MNKTKDSGMDVKVVGVTPNGKEIGYKEIGHSRFKQVAFKDGGQVPAQLKGNWTDPMSIEKAIRVYIRQAEAEVEAKAAVQETKSKPVTKQKAKSETK